jgi:lipid-binding SYLF domain-containing protein
VAIFPDLTQAGFLLAAQGGSGVFMVRHGLTWSDPVFVELAGTSFGLQAGAQVTQAVLVLMSDDGPERMLKGAFGMGGQASIAIADLGLGGGTSGSGKTGINSFFISYGEGLFAGGAIGGSQITQSKDYNLFAYGQGYDAKKIIGGWTGKVSGSAALQTLLNDATARAWNAK